MSKLTDDSKHRSVVLDVVLVGVGIAVALLILHALPGAHNWLDAKFAAAIGAVCGYAVALLLRRFWR